MFRPYSPSTNQTNTAQNSGVYVRELFDGVTSKYWVPTASKLSRGKKGIIQRIFTGQPLDNSCNVYVYNETSKLWYHEDTILGNSVRRYPPASYPPMTMFETPRAMMDGITYTATTSVSNAGGRSNPELAFGDSNTLIGAFYRIQGGYPTINNQSLPNGTYTGSTSLGGKSGEWLKLQTSTPIQPTSFKLTSVGGGGGQSEHNVPQEWTILGSNNDTNWTNLGDFTIPSGWHLNDSIIDNLTISTTYTYFALVITRRRTTTGGTYSHDVIIPNFTFTLDGISEDFGRSLDGTDNADMVAVGAPGTWFGSVSNIDGYAYVFTKDSTGNGWTQRGSVVSQQGGFGHSVALSQKDGNILVVGAPFYNTLEPNTGGNIEFNHKPVSEGRVYIYKWDGSNYTLQQTLNSPSGTLSTSTPATWKNFYFGYSLGITNVGHKIIVGEPSIRSIWSVDHQLQGGLSLPTDSFPYTGNAHVYDNVSVLSGGTTWTSNVSMTSVITTTGIGLTDDTNPSKVRWLDALGTSVDINRAGTRILAGAPGNYGTSNTAPQVMSGRIYTLDWDQTNAVWKELGENSKHINTSQNNMLLGWCTRFGGSGRRIIAGAPSYDSKGSVVTFDFDGYQWVSFPNETVEIETWVNGNSKHRLGESISVDGESEMVAIGKDEHHFSKEITPISTYSAPFPDPSRPNSFSVPDITYIGGATTSVAGSNGQISTGTSNTWVYNINQSMVIKGNVTFDGNLQTIGISIGTSEYSSNGNKSIYLGGSQSENAYEMSVIDNRVYESYEKTELLLFKGGDNANASGGGTLGPDRIRLKGGQIAFDLNTGTDRTLEDIRAVMHRNTGGAGMLGINVSSPTEVIHVDGKIKSTQGFIGRGREITGLNFDYINNTSDVRFSQAGATKSSTTWGDITINSVVAYPTLALTSNTVSGYTVTASRDVTNAYKAFDDDNSGFYKWILGDNDNITYSNGVDPGSYIGTSERIAGCKGEWIELRIPDPIFLTKLDIDCLDRTCQPRIAYVLGSNDGIEYNLIHYTGDLGSLSFANNGNNTIFTRTPDYNNDEPYDRILIIVNMISGGVADINWENIDIYGTTCIFNPKIKLDYTGKIGILNTNPSYPLDVTGDINLTGILRVGSTASTGTTGQVLISGGPSNPSSWGNVPFPSLYTNGGIVSDNNSLRIDLAASQPNGHLGIPQGGTGATSFTHYNGLIYYDVGNSDLRSIQASGASNTVLLTGSPGSVPTWGLVTLGTHTQGNYVSSINAGGGITITTGTTPQIDVSLDTNGGLGLNGSGELRIDFTNTSSIIGQLPASLVAGGSTSQWVYDSTASPPELTFDSANTGKIVGIGSPPHPSYILTVAGSVLIDQSGVSNGDLSVYGALSKGSGSFKIDHPLPSMSNTHTLCHSFIEGPKADLIYRGKVDLVNGSASINLDTVSNMTSGTFEVLNRDVQCFTSNESDWDAVKGSVSGNTLTISCQNASSTAKVSWLVIGERKDQHMYDTGWTDDDGHVVPEKAK